jgi:hypothetical protein
MHATRLIGLYIRRLQGAETEREGFNTMSSGSSGHNVTAPEPSCSILFLMQRIPAVVLYGYRPGVSKGEMRRRWVGCYCDVVIC